MDEAELKRLREDALRELTAIGTDIRSDIWTDLDGEFLKLMAGDIAGLTKKLLIEQDETKRKRLRRSIDLIANHVAVMTFSRLNVLQQRVEETLLLVLKKTANLVIKSLLARFALER